MLEGPVVADVDDVLVTLILIVLVGIKHVGNDTGKLVMFCWDGPMDPDVEVVVGLMVVPPCCVLMLEIE